MSKSHKLFVSFSADDNTSGKDGKGWIDEFSRYLSIFLHRITGELPEIIYLHQSDGKNAQPTSNDALIIIASPVYLKKEVYKEVIPLIGDGSHVFKIDLTPIRKSQQPKELRVLNEFRFFVSGFDKNEGVRTLSISSEGQTFWLKIIDLAFEIGRVVYDRSDQQKENNVRKIFLAETSYDQVSNRDEIKRELRRHGHIVLPSIPLSSDLKDLEVQIDKYLNEVDLTVQIIGEEYGETLDNSDKSIVEVQNDLINKHFRKEGRTEQDLLRRLIWMPISLKPTSDTQKIYLDRLREDIDSTAGAEIIQTPLEILKTVIHSRLFIFNQEKIARTQTKKERSERKSVYLLFDKKDEGDISSIINELNERKIQVILPDFTGKQIELLYQHRRNLIETDSVLLYANKNLNWVNSKLNDVIKAPGFGRDEPFRAKGILIKDASIEKDKIANFGDLIVLNGKGGKSDLSPFTDKIAE